MLSRLCRARGFSLIELSIVLLIAGLLIGGVFGITSNMQKQRADQATANEMRTVITALERYIQDNQAALVANATSGSTTPTTPNISCGPNTDHPACTPTNPTTAAKALLWNPVTSATMVAQSHIGYANEAQYFQANYIPGGTGGIDVSSATSNYTIGLANFGAINTANANTNAGQNIRGLVIRNLGYTIPDDSRLARVSALIGSQGGMIPNAPPGCGANSGNCANSVQGTFGAWQATPLTYGITTVANAQIAAYTANVDSQINTNLLSRISTGNPEANTMHNSLTMGNDNNTQDNLNNLASNNINDILINPTAAPANNTNAPNSILNTGGVGYLISDAVSGTLCFDKDITDSIISTTLYNINSVPSAATPTLTPIGYYYRNDPRVRNMTVYGSAANGPVAILNGYSVIAQPTLLQCSYNAAATPPTWTWQVAVAPVTQKKWFNLTPGPAPANSSLWTQMKAGTFTNTCSSEIIENFTFPANSGQSRVFRFYSDYAPLALNNTVLAELEMGHDQADLGLTIPVSITISPGHSLYVYSSCDHDVHEQGGPACQGDNGVIEYWAEYRDPSDSACTIRP